ncbi:MAG: hypothetical protein BJ554DRAFT_7026, partial [Olpidium bornovanus]
GEIFFWLWREKIVTPARAQPVRRGTPAPQPVTVPSHTHARRRGSGGRALPPVRPFPSLRLEDGGHFALRAAPLVRVDSAGTSRGNLRPEYLHGTGSLHGASILSGGVHQVGLKDHDPTGLFRPPAIIAIAVEESAGGWLACHGPLVVHDAASPVDEHDPVHVHLSCLGILVPHTPCRTD